MRKELSLVKTELKSFILLLSVLLLTSCGVSGRSDTPASVVGGGTGAAATAANIALTANPSTLTTGGTASIQATVTTSTGANIADGTSVAFTLSSSTMGTITSSATTSNGIAQATFTALTVPGTVTITATSGSVSQTAAAVISAPSAGSLEFVSATPQVIGLKGGGQTASSAVIFLVKDITGSPVIDGTQVSFVMSGPSGGKLPSAGGEYIGDIDASPKTATASTIAGKATVTLNSGAVAGPVTITASVTVGTQTFSASSAVISIGGGGPSASHFTLAASTLNVPGLVIVNSQSTISAYLADRFGNYNVLTGTSVSFYTEAGAIDRSKVTDATGLTSALFRTQNPLPVTVSALTASELALINALNATYGLAIPVGGSVNPRNGRTTILATVQGEEGFNDANANGLYDAGETFTDQGEPFIDKNEDGCRNDGVNKNCNGVISASTDPFEEYIDVNGNGVYDGPNGVWDGPGCTGTGCLTSKMISKSIVLGNTGSVSVSTPYCAISPAAFAILNAGTQAFSFMVGDQNLNALVPGTTISVTATLGTLTGQSSYTVPNYVPNGPSQISFSLADATPGTTAVPAAPATITVTVAPPTGTVVGCTATASGTIQ